MLNSCLVLFELQWHYCSNISCQHKYRMFCTTWPGHTGLVSQQRYFVFLLFLRWKASTVPLNQTRQLPSSSPAIIVLRDLNNAVNLCGTANTQTSNNPGRAGVMFVGRRTKTRLSYFVVHETTFAVTSFPCSNFTMLALFRFTWRWR